MTRKQTADYDISRSAGSNIPREGLPFPITGFPNPISPRVPGWKYLIAVGAVIILAVMWRKLKGRKDSV